jgi:serine/threonine protein kinase
MSQETETIPNDPSNAKGPNDRLHEAIASFEMACDAGQNPDPQEWLKRYPDVGPKLAEYFEGIEQLRVAASKGWSKPVGDVLQMNTDFQVGETIGNRWKVENILHGGMGLVYVVTDRHTSERLAAKTYRDDRLAANPGLASRFEKEALAWIRLGAHPNVVQAKYVETVRRKPFLFLEYVPGGNLLHRLPLNDLNQARWLAIQFCDGMIHAARFGITAHRDIKPENCLYHNYLLKISDFGLAKCFDDLVVAPDLPFVLRASDGEDPTPPPHEAGSVDHCSRLGSMSMIVTRTGVAAGTPGYMAPEQFDDVKRIDVKADIYSFGVMLFQMITGRLPFSGRSLAEYRHLHQQVRPPKVSREEPLCRQWLAGHGHYRVAGIDLERDGMPRWMSDIVARCLAKDPTRRFEDFRAVREALVRADPGDPYETCSQPPPLLVRARQQTEDELLALGLSYLQLGRESLALAAFDRLIERYPRNTRGYLEKGKLLMTMPHRHDEGRAILEQAQSIGGRPYTQLDADAVLPKILDDVLDQLFKEFEQANRAFVIFREGTSGSPVVKASRMRWPQDEDTAQDFLSDERRIDAIRECLDTGQSVTKEEAVEDAGEVLGFRRRSVICVPMRGPFGKAFGVMWLETQDYRKKLTQEDLQLLSWMIGSAGENECPIPLWLFPFFHATRHCFVLCRAAGPGHLSHAGEVVARVFGRGYSAEVAKENIVTVMRGESTVGLLAHMPAPIPNHEAEENADGNFLWPNGKAEAAEHRSHVIVTNIGAGDQTPIQSAIAVSRLALAALKLFDGIGVYWGNASVCNSREVFERFCENLSEEHVPVPVWLRFQLVRGSDDEVGLYTLGMSQFGLMEIEVDRSRIKVQDLFEFVSNIAHHLIQSGPVIADGNTVGGNEVERILVRHRAHRVGRYNGVYKIRFLKGNRT